MTRVALFGVVLAALFAAAVGVGAAVGPVERGRATATAPMAMGGASSAGLAVADHGLRLVPARMTFATGRTRPFTFRIVDEAGRAVRAFDVKHTKRLHLIVVRRDLTGFQHLHPGLRADGTWSVPLRLDAAGDYRALADFSTGGTKTVLGVDLAAAGPTTRHALPAPSRVATADGYRVQLRDGAPTAGAESPLAFSITRAGRPVHPGPYLGARGHLVVLRQGDLAYSHVHPHDDSLEFDADFPTVGRYRAFLQFPAGGSIHTAAFTFEVPR